MCGLAASLAKSSDLMGIQWVSEARHYPTDHAAGGLYENLPNASFANGKHFYLINTSSQDLMIRI